VAEAGERERGGSLDKEMRRSWKGRKACVWGTIRALREFISIEKR